MNLHTRYIISTVGYGVCAILGLVVGTFFVVNSHWLLAILAAIFVYVAVDNFFCGDRCRVAGLKVKGEYVVPPFLKVQK